MNLSDSKKSKPTSDRPRLLVLCLLLSLGLHLFVVLVLPLFQPQEQQPAWQQPPTIVQLVDRPKKIKQPPTEQPRELEIDQQPLTPALDIPVVAVRQAEKDQMVVREQAPKGDDVRDQTSQPPRPSLPVQQQQSVQADKQPQQQRRPEAAQPEQEKGTKKAAEKAPATATTAPGIETTRPPLLSPEQLQPDSSVLEQIVRGSQAERDRVKQRKDVAIGDTIWLNLQHNLLISFFRRFHDQIEMVWNYPTEAVQHGIEGTLELLIVVDPKGELLDVDLIHSSGSDLLDFEAIQAVYRAAPFGPLTKHYPHEKLNIRAYFSYQISGKYIYGR